MTAIFNAGETFEGIQVLRFVAAFLVVFHHSADFLSDSGAWFNSNFGGYGVNLFFVISGIVMITATSGGAESRQNWKIFILRRLIRIVPIYWVATSLKLVVALALPGSVQHAEPSLRVVLRSLFFLPTPNVDGNYYPFHNVGWTLNFEMAFYLLVALALFFQVKPFTLGLILIPIVAILGLANENQTAGPAYLFYFDSIVLYFLAGMVVGSFIVGRGRSVLYFGLSVVLATWFIFYAEGTSSTSAAAERLIEPVAIVAIVLASVFIEGRIRGKVPKSLLALGEASYSIYLFHSFLIPIVAWTIATVGIQFESLPGVAILALLATIASVPWYWCVEKPVTSFLKRKLISKRS